MIPAFRYACMLAASLTLTTIAAAPAAENPGDPLNAADLNCASAADRDPDHETAKSIFRAHVAFEVLYSMLETRCAVGDFVARLRTSQPDADKITSDDLVDAATPKTVSERLSAYLDRTRRRVERMLVGDEERIRRANEMQREGIYYEGEFDANGQPSGSGLSIDRAGVLRRGNFNAGRLDGNGAEVRPDGTVAAGSYKSGELSGDGAVQNPAGTTLEGTFDHGLPVGEVIAVFPDGSRQRQIRDASGTMVALGPLVAPEDASTLGAPTRDPAVALTREDPATRTTLQAGIDSAETWETNRPARETMARNAAAAKAEMDRLAAAARSAQQQQEAAEAARKEEERKQRAARRNSFLSTLGAVVLGTAQAYVESQGGDSGSVYVPPLPSAPAPAPAPAADSGSRTIITGAPTAADLARLHNADLEANNCISVIDPKAQGIPSNFSYHIQNRCGFKVWVIWTGKAGRFDNLESIAASSTKPLADSQGFQTRFIACRDAGNGANVHSEGTRLWCN